MSASTSTAEPCVDLTYYEENYPHYEAQNPPRKLRHYARLIEEHRAQDTPRRIHDVGCAFGGFLTTLDSTWELFGSDINAEAIRIAREAVPHGTFRVVDPAARETFEETLGVITAFDVLEHIAEIDEVGERIHDGLVPGGLFVFVVPVYDGLSGPLIRRLDKDPTHVHKWPRSRWLEWAATRFQILHWHGTLRYLLPRGLYVHWPTRLWRWHTPAIVVVCQKAPDR